MSTTGFTVIVPVYNAEDTLVNCVNSIIEASKLVTGCLEVLLIDDCSTDNSPVVISRLVDEHNAVRAFKTQSNSGPGAARNIGIEQAQEPWILFVDADDQLDSSAFQSLTSFLGTNSGKDCEIIAFDWDYGQHSNAQIHTQHCGRSDTHYLGLGKAKLISSYLRMHLDHSVIYCAFRTDLLKRNQLTFSNDYHEDVDFLFKAYWHAECIHVLEALLYHKNSRQHSIVNTISTKHLDGFIRAYVELAGFLDRHCVFQDYASAYSSGIIALLATRAREICRHGQQPSKRAELFQHLYNSMSAAGLLQRVHLAAADRSLYRMIFDRFVEVMGSKSLPQNIKEVKVYDFINSNSSKRWSCSYLHHGIYLRPEEIRTCCKRFFVDDLMQGDVTILDNTQIQPNGLMVDEVIAAKSRLFNSINRGEATPCDGCPFMEFKEWPSIEQSKITTLSFEYHSVCNLVCTYCSDEYYGGLKVQYDIEAFVQQLLQKNSLAEDATIIWGGGEPVADKAFPRLITSILNALPRSRHRVITNAVKYCKTTAELLGQGKVMVYSSLDAGTRETYERVRGKDRFRKQLTNLQRYAEAGAENTFVKYIFTEGNSSEQEVLAFVDTIQEYKLLSCTFQISYDFTEERVEPFDLALMALMYKCLSDLGVDLVFVDELIRQRVANFTTDDTLRFERELEKLGISDVLFKPNRENPLIIWGAGEQSRLLLENSLFLKPEYVDFFADSTPNKLGTTYFGREIRSPDTVGQSDHPILIAATQNFAPIFRQFRELGIDEGRLVRKFII
ncbi:glycosyltransferase [Pseudomaricurvus alkylphenolicus]|uniref:glycosyltransferase n=1 Tax=Pseudomaricurvus alkylphenolicus TaxID=1306991 RepID=UPI0014239983|nr:glycosyltransferase [Pseudomaricurvus alkylphenolicus]NIB40030.1 glycosyltransferase [Pseudomaricurvus alkylphenolicus]